MSTKLNKFLRAFQSRTLCNLSSYSTAAEIDIPKRISRSATDILKAIASTYQRDPTAPHYKYHDDPYLIPYSNFTKRSYALSQESGRKAAQWIRQQHADLFQHKVAEPFIEAFVPKPVYTEESEVNEQVLLNLIRSALVSDAITVYNILKKNGVELQTSTKESLLELLCFYNSEDPVSEDWIEERWFRSSVTSNKSKNNWRSNALVEELFKELKDSTQATYSAIICGMAIHGELQKAMETFQEAIVKGVPLSVEVYNCLLSKAHSMRENHEKIWEQIQYLLSEMNARKVHPNIRTLNGVLESLSKMTSYRLAKKYAFQILAEFKALHIEPSLATFLYLLEVHFKDRQKLYGILSEVLTLIEQNKYHIVDPKDVLFYVRAMEICCIQLHNKELAYRLHNTLLNENNYNFIGDSYKESLYYRNFFFILSEAETLEKVMEFYEDVVPGIYIPEPAVMNAILKAVDINLAWNLLPKLWSDIVLFDQAEVSGLLENMLSCSAKNTDELLHEKMSKIAWDIWEQIEGSKKERSLLQWTASMLGNIVLILLKGNEKAKAHLVMDKLIRLGSTLMNEPPVEAMQMYIQSCIEENSPELAIKTIQYCDSVGFMETAQFAKLLNTSIELTEKQNEKLVSIVGEECLRKTEKKPSEQLGAQDKK